MKYAGYLIFIIVYLSHRLIHKYVLSVHYVYMRVLSLWSYCPEILFLFAASHLPYNRNGFKFFTNAGGLGKADIKDILERAANVYQKFSAESLKQSEQAAAAVVRKVDYMTVYASILVKAVRKAAGNIGIFSL